MDKPLKTIFHIDEQEYKKVYEKRFSSPYTEHFDFNVKCDNKGNTAPIFLCITKDMLLTFFNH